MLFIKAFWLNLVPKAIRKNSFCYLLIAKRFAGDELDYWLFIKALYKRFAYIKVVPKQKETANENKKLVQLLRREFIKGAVRTISWNTPF